MQKAWNAPALKRVWGVGLLLSLSIITTGCGKGSGIGSMVEGVEVKTYEQAGDLWVEMKSRLSTGALILSGLNLPIVDPKNPAKVYGQLAVNSTFCGAASCGGSELVVQLNVTQISGTAALAPTLPNGTAIPVGGLGSTTIVALPVGNTGARIYVGVGKDVALLGFALPFKEFDKIGSYVPGINLFQPFGEAADKVRGIVGLFTGAGQGQNGLALFIDMSGLIKPSVSMMAKGFRGELTTSSRVESAEDRPTGRLIFQEIKPNRRDEYNLYYELDRLNRRGTRLNVK